jgi:hypothetical protein
VTSAGVATVTMPVALVVATEPPADMNGTDREQ